MTDTNKIYIDIHSLLDLRQGTLIELMGLEETTEYVNTNEYNFRDRDIFPVDMERYNILLKEGNKSILRNSTITYMETVLLSKIPSLERHNIYNHTHRPPEIIVNMYPFNLEEYHLRLIQNAIFVKFGSNIQITLVNEELDVYTPYLLKNSNFVYFLSYFPNQWLDKHSKSLDNKEPLSTTLYFPAIAYRDLTEQDFKGIKDLGFKDIYSYTEYLLSSSVNITFLPIFMYSNTLTGNAIAKKYKTDIVKPISVKDNQ